MSNFDLLVTLIEKFRKRPLTEAEKKKLKEWLATIKDKDSFNKLLHDPSWILNDLRVLSQIDMDKGWNKLLTHISASKASIRRNNKYFPFALAAAILACCFTLLLVYTVSKNVHYIPASTVDYIKTKSGIRAVLVLHNGRRIVLDSCKNGFLCQQGNTCIFFNNNKIMYKVLPGIPPLHEPLYNQIITYREGPYQITLPDNSQVWLNAASSIKFPVEFYTAERNVEISGEAYFDVAHLYGGNRPKKFIVHVNNHINRNMKVEVLGTRFNINAYGLQESIKTTLLEGRIKVFCSDKDTLLMPGQQAQAYEKAIVVKKAVDTNQAIGWKEGYFKFSAQSLITVLIEIARWHDLDLKILGNEPRNNYISGAISHKESLEHIISAIASGTNCNIYRDGKNLVVNFR